MKKCAWIYSDKDQGQGSCPFGLPIIDGCKHAGDSVMHMCPLKMASKNKYDAIKKANMRVYLYYKTDNRCSYAANIVEKYNVVNCDFGDTGAGMSVPAFTGSPLYPQTFSGIGLDGLYAFPLGFYADNNESRNLFQGLFSLVGNEIYEIIKEANIKEISDKIINDEPLNNEEMMNLVQLVDKCRQIFNDNTIDTSRLYQLIKKWGPRNN